VTTSTPSLRPTLVRGEGVHVWDADGRRYLDAISGSFAVQLGYGRADLVRALTEAASRLPYARPSRFESAESEAYAEELLLAAGPPYKRALFTSSGSEAVEVALKAAHRYQSAKGRPGRTRITHLRGHFHGATLAALGVTDYRPRRDAYDAILAGGPAFDEGAADLEGELGSAAALIAETIPAVGRGASLPRPGFLREVRRACDRQDALWIADEILTGFGRVGSLFAWKRLAEDSREPEAKPDIVVFGKGAGAGYAAIAGVLLAERVAAVLDAAPGGAFSHAQTYGGHAPACAVGRRVLAAMREEKIEARVREKEGALRDAWTALSAHPHVLDVRGLGFLWGMVLRKDRESGKPFPRERKIAERVEAACRDRGLLVFSGSGSHDGNLGDHLLIGPPLVSDAHHFPQIAIGIRESLDAVMRDT